MRISVSLIVNLVVNDTTVDDIVADYPDLNPEDIRQALRYAAGCISVWGFYAPAPSVKGALCIARGCPLTQFRVPFSSAPSLATNMGPRAPGPTTLKGNVHGLSIHDIFFHLLRADGGWRIGLETGRQLPPAAPEDFATLAAIRAGFEQEQAAWTRYLDGLSDDAVQASIQLVNRRGDQVTFTHWRILQHLILHGMQHHAELAQLLTRKGQSPGDIDFIFYR